MRSRADAKPKRDRCGPFFDEEEIRWSITESGYLIHQRKWMSKKVIWIMQKSREIIKKVFTKISIGVFIKISIHYNQCHVVN